jgi:hypothetical protein
MADAKTLEQRIQALEDHIEIMNFVIGYSTSVDSQSPDNRERFWLPDATVDMGQGPKPYETMMQTLYSEHFKTAQAQGIGHFTGPPHIVINGDEAVATAYFQILAADDRPFELAAHGPSKGFRVWRLTVNRWELKRTPKGWRVKNRTLRAFDNPASREVLRQTLNAA